MSEGASLTKEEAKDLIERVFAETVEVIEPAQEETSMEVPPRTDLLSLTEKQLERFAENKDLVRGLISDLNSIDLEVGALGTAFADLESEVEASRGSVLDYLETEESDSTKDNIHRESVVSMLFGLLEEVDNKVKIIKDSIDALTALVKYYKPIEEGETPNEVRIGDG